MNNYQITFERSNGTIGSDTFTENTKQEAVKAFKECYRHDTYTIISIDIKERLDLIKEGVERIKSAGRINTTDFEDICNKLADYGMGFCDAQNVITAAYLHERGVN